MPYTLLAPVLYNQATVGQAYASSTTITDVSTNPQYVLPPNTVTTVGQTLKLHAGGVFSNTGTPNLTMGFYKNTQTSSGATGVGGAAIAASAATATASSVSNIIWMLDYEGVFTAVGASATVFGYGIFWLGTSATAITAIPIPNATPQTAVSWNTTVPNLITVGATWGTSSASNTLVCNDFSIELKN